MNGDSMFSFSNNSSFQNQVDYHNLREIANQVLQDAPPTTSNFSYSQPIEEPPRYHEMQPRQPQQQPQHQPSTQPAVYDPYEFVSSNSTPQASNSPHDSVVTGNRQDLGKICG